MAEPRPEQEIRAIAVCRCGVSSFRIKIYEWHSLRICCTSCSKEWEGWPSAGSGQGQNIGSNQALGSLGSQSSNLVSAAQGKLGGLGDKIYAGG